MVFVYGFYFWSLFQDARLFCSVRFECECAPMHSCLVAAWSLWPCPCAERTSFCASVSRPNRNPLEFVRVTIWPTWFATFWCLGQARVQYRCKNSTSKTPAWQGFWNAQRSRASCIASGSSSAEQSDARRWALIPQRVKLSNLLWRNLLNLLIRSNGSGWFFFLIRASHWAQQVDTLWFEPSSRGKRTVCCANKWKWHGGIYMYLLWFLWFVSLLGGGGWLLVARWLSVAFVGF